jgi:hypothetical protein
MHSFELTQKSQKEHLTNISSIEFHTSFCLVSLIITIIIAEAITMTLNKMLKCHPTVMPCTNNLLNSPSK